MEHFTPISAATGGVLIGLSATLLWVSIGRIAGISGIVGGLWNLSPGDLAWRLAFAIGLIAGPVLFGLADVELPKIIMSAPSPVVIGAGFLVGLGTRLGSGCTSGHGVCGLARFSPRSAAATVSSSASPS
jgi:uncharacterized membrane protein YedE/YeeE